MLMEVNQNTPCSLGDSNPMKDFRFDCHSSKTRRFELHDKISTVPTENSVCPSKLPPTPM
jgi:hypothetical protein